MARGERREERGERREEKTSLIMELVLVRKRYSLNVPPLEADVFTEINVSVRSASEQRKIEKRINEQINKRESIRIRNKSKGGESTNTQKKD